MGTSNNSNQISNLLLVGGVLVLMIQNLLLFLFSITTLEDDEYIFEQLYAVYNGEFQWFLDIVGFLLLALAFFMKSNETSGSDSQSLKMIAGGFGAWVFLRILWQFILMPDVESQLVSAFGGSAEDLSFDGAVTVFLLASLVLLVTGYLLFKFDRSNLLFLIYTAFNFASSIFIFMAFHSSTSEGDTLSNPSAFSEFMTFQAKFIIIPLLALSAFYKLAEDELKTTFGK